MTAVMLGIPKQRRRVSISDLATEKGWNSLSESEFQELVSLVQEINRLLFRRSRPEATILGDCYTDDAGDTWALMYDGEWFKISHTDSTLGLEPWLVFGYQS